MNNDRKIAKPRYGFAGMDTEKQREIASKGGKAAHEQGKAHQWTHEEAVEAGKKGGKLGKLTNSIEERRELAREKKRRRKEEDPAYRKKLRDYNTEYQRKRRAERREKGQTDE